MADDQEASNEVADEVEEPEIADYDEAGASSSTVVVPGPAPQDVSSTPVAPVVPDAGDYDDEPIDDFVVKLVVDGTADASNSAKDLVTAAITDSNGNLLPTQSSVLVDALNNYSTTIYDELNGSTTAIANERKGLWGKKISSVTSTATRAKAFKIAMCVRTRLLAQVKITSNR